MPEPGQITYSLKEMTELMIRDQGIRTGFWMVWAQYAYSVTIAVSGDPSGPTGPAVVSLLTEIGIQRAPEPGPLTVDASEVWKRSRGKEPKPEVRARKGTGKGK